MAVLMMFGIMILLILLGAPVFIAMGIACVALIMTSDAISLVGVANNLFSGINSFALLAVPFYLLTGELMNTGGITKRLMNLAQAAVGHFKGGLAQVNIVSSMAMAGMSGSASADAATTSKVLIPEMEKKGYPRAFAAAVTACSSVIGPVIPPSINMLVFASVAGVSVGKIFIGGIVPGVVMGLYLMITTYIIAKKRGYGSISTFSFKTLFRSIYESILPLLTPVIILGGIVFGLYTPTEAAIAAAIYAGILGFYYKELKLKDLPGIFLSVTKTTAAVVIIVGISNVMGWLAALEGAPQMILEFFVVNSASALVVVLSLLAFYLILGLVMDGIAITLLTVPVIMPILTFYDIDPIYFGVVMVVALMIGQITPPVGMVMFITTNIAKVNVISFMREAYPYLIALVLALLTMALFPEAILWLPDLLLSNGSGAG